LVKATAELGNGNLHVKVDPISKDEINLLETSFNKTVESLRLQQHALLEKQKEISMQAGQLQLVNAELHLKNKELDRQKEEILLKKAQLEQQKEEITAQAENLIVLNQEITQMNANLESMVQERTQQLAEQNKQLAEYAFTNAHKLRGPLTRIMGLINVIHLAEKPEEKMHYINLLSEAGNQLDQVVHQIQQLLSENDNSQRN
jgi:signal transduction histidine kinase